MSDGIDAPVEKLQPTTLDPMLDSLRPNPERRELPTGDDAMLLSRKLRNGLIKMASP